MFDIRRLFAARRALVRPPPALRRALAALETGQYDEALDRLAALLDAARRPQERAFLLNKLGIGLVGLGRRDEARAAFGASLAEIERYAPALVNLGNMLLEDGALEDAVALYQAALRADEDYAGAHLNLSVALKRLGRTAEAVRHLRKARTLEARPRS
jgi:tetratricopeptide (TPR) repeat protein